MYLFALIYFVLGIILCFFNKTILYGATRIIGGVLIIYGALELYLYFGKRTAPSSALFAGIPCVLIGLFLLITPQSLVAILPVLCGVILILNSLVQMQKSFALKNSGYTNWIYSFIVSLLILVGGIVLLLHPIQTLNFILQLVGVCLMVEAIVIVFNQIEINKYLG